MEEDEKIFGSIKTMFPDLEMSTRSANERLRLFLKGLSVDEMILKMRGLNFSARSLNFLCECIALEHEDYEICMAVEAIKKENGLKSILVDM